MKNLALFLIFLVVTATAYYVIREPEPVPRFIPSDPPTVQPPLGSNPPSDFVAPPEIEVEPEGTPFEPEPEEVIIAAELEPEEIIQASPSEDVRFHQPEPEAPEQETVSLEPDTELTNAQSTAQPVLLLTEIMFHPPHQKNAPENTLLEYLEFYNSSTEAIQLEGYRIIRGVQFVFPEMTLAPGAYVIVGKDRDTLTSHYSGATVLGNWEGQLSNSAETVELVDGEGKVVQSVRYADEGEWAQRVMGQEVVYARRRNDPFASRDTRAAHWEWLSQADGNGHSLQRLSLSADPSSGQNWSASSGSSPGKENPIKTDVIAPLITEVKHSPVVPTAMDEVVVTAELSTVSDEAVQLSLHWRLSELQELPFQEMPMQATRPGVFSASLPAHPTSTIVEYYVSAKQGDLARTWPAETDSGQLTNALYQVDDEVFVPGFSFYRIIMTAKSAVEFASIDRQSNFQKNVTMVFDDGKGPVSRHLCGIRPRGQGSRNHTPVPLKINIPSDRPWNDVTSMNLNTRFPWLQFIGMKIITASDLPAPAMIPVQVRINGENQARGSNIDFGAYVHAQPMSTEFVDQMFWNDNGGNLYSKGRPQRNRNSWAYQNGRPELYENDGWDKQTKSGAWDWSDLDFFLKTMNEAPRRPNYLEQVEAVIHVDQWLRALAVMQLMANGEGSLATGADDDYAIYRGLTETRFILLPHDLDTILGSGEGNRIANPQHTLLDMIELNDSMEQLKPLFSEPTIRKRYFEQMRNLLRTSFAPKAFDELLDNQLKHWVPQSTIANMKTFMAMRRQYAERQIRNQLGEDKPKGIPSSPTVKAAQTGPLRINEVLASNKTAFPHGENESYPDAIEIYNAGSEEISLGGMSLTDRAEEPRRFVFPEGTSLAAGAYMTVFAADQLAEPGLFLGFGLGAEGETLTLYAAAEDGAPINIIDTVTFGHQLDDCSIARIGADGDTWALAKPTLGGPNEPLPTSSPAVVKINEWMARPNARYKDDFLELCNPGELPVALGGLSLTDDRLNAPKRFTIPPLSFVGGRDFIVFTAKGSKTGARDGVTLPFKLAAQQGWIFFNDAQGGVIDQVHYHSQRSDVSEGRLPNAGSSYQALPIPSPGGMNVPIEEAGGQEGLALSDALRVTELMYHPVDPETEFIELMNLGKEPLDLTGVRFSEGIDFEFSNFTLESGERIVVVLNETAFKALYGRGIKVAGEYGGKLSNGGEWITLSPPEDQAPAIQRFKFSDAWWPETDGTGNSLVITDPRAPVAAWSEVSQWEPSSETGGSPGR